MKHNKIDDDILQRLRETQMEILDEIVRICEKHNLTYFLVYGTLLGAIRHNGFIPWDDDLDIGMPRDDYEKFMQVCKEDLDSKYFLQNQESEPDYWLNFAKVRKNNTLFKEEALMHNNHNHQGIFVDIFPLDYTNVNDGKRLHLRSILARAINETMHYKAGIYDTLDGQRYKKIDIFLKMFSIKQLHKMFKKIAIRKNKNCAYYVDFNGNIAWKECIFKIDETLPCVDHVYENRQYKVPCNYDAHLTMIFGDYMQLPKEEDRFNHMTTIIEFE